jgi:hypothetical protein
MRTILFVSISPVETHKYYLLLELSEPTQSEMQMLIEPNSLSCLMWYPFGLDQI